uniref:Golgi-associated plant pathogenesis-related protein 1 n=1 Tax=Ascaris suum TaxID=6253 RepID=F1LD82_ASCSU
MSLDSAAFCQQILEAHNRLRQQHGSPALTLNSDLSEQAQHWAEKLAARRHLAYCELPGIGENITFFPIWIDGEKVVEHWYSENMKYEYDTPGWQAGTNYFTQVVWKTTEEIGVGRAFILPDTTDGNGDMTTHAGNLSEQVVVAFYRPAGNNNRVGQFAANVHKPTNINSIGQE